MASKHVYLLDTNVISLTSPFAAARSPDIQRWSYGIADESFLSVVSLSEIQFGVSRLVQRGAQRKAELLGRWTEVILGEFLDRLLPIDAVVARRTGELLARTEAAGHEPGFEDACIAATADVNRLLVVTNNARHFRALGVAHRKPGP